MEVTGPNGAPPQVPLLSLTERQPRSFLCITSPLGVANLSPQTATWCSFEAGLTLKVALKLQGAPRQDYGYGSGGGGGGRGGGRSACALLWVAKNLESALSLPWTWLLILAGADMILAMVAAAAMEVAATAVSSLRGCFTHYLPAVQSATLTGTEALVTLTTLRGQFRAVCVTAR